MLSLEKINTAAERLTTEGTRLLEACDSLQAQKSKSLAEARRELSAAQRAVRSLTSGSAEMQAIGQTIKTQIDLLEERVESAADESAVIKAWQKKVARVVELLGSGVESGRAPTAALVRPIVLRLIDESGGMTYDEVYERVRNLLARDELPANGLGLRVREALVDPTLDADERGVYRPITKSTAMASVPLKANPRKPPATDGATQPEVPPEHAAS